MALVTDTDWIRLLRDDDIDEFNRRAAKARPDLRNGDLRMLDLRRVNLREADLRGAYLRDSDLRGVDLSQALLDGASIRGARLSGTFFPRDLSAHEIGLSLAEGIRMRADRP